jgi:arylsulfatase A
MHRNHQFIHQPLIAVSILLLALCLNLTELQVASAAEKPNVVFILADDLGYGELGCYGQEKIRTPNIDRLAANGMRFTQHYSGAPVCAPARCVLLTGQNLAHAEIRGNKDSGNGRVFPGQWPLSDGIVTIAEAFKQVNYATGAFGKWGLGPSNSTGSPIKQGFDRYYGYNCQRNAHSFFPFFLDSDEREERINSGLIYGHQQKPVGDVDAADYRLENYAPDMILKEALKFIDKNRKRPFFLYLPFVEPHVSIQPPQEWIDKYPQEWDVEKGAYRGQNGYLPHPRPRAAYAAMISDLDEHVGAVISKLEEHGLTENTLIVFTSDNGTTHGGRDPKFNIGGVDAEFFNSTAGLRGWKGSVYEGGLRVPCIVKWPHQVAAGSVTDVASYFPDWFPTLCNVVKAPLPDCQQLDGIDLASVLRGKSASDRKELMIWDFHNYGGLVAIRDGKWKAIRRNLLKKPTPWELYDIEQDKQESNDLAAQYPDVVKRLETEYVKTRTREPDFPVPFYDLQK